MSATQVTTSPVRAPADDEDRFHSAFLWTAAGLAAVALWIRPLSTSLWVDEFGTWWVVDGTFHDVITRTEAVQGQSPLYFVGLWLVKGVLGNSEAALRLPSLVCIGVSAFLIYRIANRLADRETARLAVVAFAVWPQIVFAASDARPYALATVLAIGAAWALIRWLDEGGKIRATAAVGLAALVPYAHPLAGPVLVPLALYAAFRRHEGSTDRSVRSLLVAAGTVVVLMVPVAIEVLRLAGRQGDWEIPNQPTVSWVVAMLMPAAFACGVLVTLVLARWASTAHDPRSLPRSTLVLVLGWFLIPASVLVALAVLTPVQLVSFRYFIVAAPAGALIAGALARAIEPPRIRRIVVAAVVVASVLDLATPFQSGDMRGALAIAAGAADEHTVTLVRSGFVESMQMSWYKDPIRSGFLTAATSYYPIPGEVIPISVDLTPEMAAFTKDRIDEAMPSADRFIAVTLTGSPFEPWLDEVFRERGYTSTELGEVNLFTVTEFTRQPS